MFVRLQRPLPFNDLPEVDIGTKFLFFFTGPPIKAVLDDDEPGPSQYVDIGISLATAFTEKDFIAEVSNTTSQKHSIIEIGEIIFQSPFFKQSSQKSGDKRGFKLLN